MARFFGTVAGARGEATRLGAQQLTATARGWDVGGELIVSIGPDGRDQVAVYATRGSHAPYARVLLGTIRDGATDAPVFTPATAGVAP